MKFATLLKLSFFSVLCISCSLQPFKTVHTNISEKTVDSKTQTAPKTDNSLTTTMHSENDEPLTSIELSKYTYEVGLDPKKELSSEDLITIKKRKRLRNLERSLDSQKERYNYSKVLPWLQNDDEKIEYLSIPSIEGRQAWINKKQIWKRSKNTKEYQDIMESLDIAVGMPTEFVKKAWGEPDSIEHSGNPIYKNERWKYIKQIATPHGYRPEKRYVYFEGGRVVGWETE